MASLIWVITGCSSGLGEQLAKAALARGDRVIATARNAQKRLLNLKELGAATLDYDSTWSPERLHDVAQQAVAIYGSIDVVVNNAGFTEGGMAEELSQDKLLLSLHTNVLGPLAFTQALLPHLRDKKSGTIMFVGSIGTFMTSGLSGSTAYIGTKSYLEALAGAMQEELAAWNIRVCLVEAGYLRTELWSDKNVKKSTFESEGSAYKDINQAILAMIRQVDGHQPGDPGKAAALILDAVYGENSAAGKKLPLRLPVGEDIIAAMRGKAQQLNEVCDEWESAAKVAYEN